MNINMTADLLAIESSRCNGNTGLAQRSTLAQEADESTLAATQGGIGPLVLLLVGAGLATVGFVAKDIYDNWGLFKTEFMKAYNAQ